MLPLLKIMLIRDGGIIVKDQSKLIIFVFSIIIGVFIANQMKSNVEYYIPITLESLENTKAEIEAIKKEIVELNERFEEKEEQLERLKSISKGEENILDILKKEVRDNKIQAGFYDMEGPGISIKMYDNPEQEIIGFSVDDDIVHDVDILNIINDLRLAGAEAISINGERLINSSEIKCGGPIIRINEKSFATPFVLEAIGDPKVLMAAVNAPGTYGDTLKNIFFIGLEPREENNIIIPAYRGDLDFKYARPKGEGES